MGGASPSGPNAAALEQAGWRRRTRPAQRRSKPSAAGCDALRRAVTQAAGQRPRPPGRPALRLLQPPARGAVRLARRRSAPPPRLAVPSSESRLSASATRPRAAAERAKTPSHRTGGRRLQAPRLRRGEARPGQGGRAGHGSRAASCRRRRLLAPLAAGAPAQRPHRALRAAVAGPSASPAGASEGRRHESDRVLREDPGGRAVRRRPHESFQPHPAGGDPLPEGRGQGEWPGARGGEWTGKARGSIWRFLETEEGDREAGKGKVRQPGGLVCAPGRDPATAKFSARSGWAAIATRTVPGHGLGPRGLGVGGSAPGAGTGRG